MKKHFAKISAALLVLCSLTACSEGGAGAQPENQSSVTDSAPSGMDSSSLDTESSSSDSESESSDSTSESKPKTVCFYGETEIPDIPCGNIKFEGKASDLYDQEALKQCLDSMVFETHTLGGYTIRLVGDRVRTDKTNFPDSIYVHDLYIEVEQGGEKIGEGFGYSDYILYGMQFEREFRLLTNRIGNYIDIYDLDNPVIAMRYFFDDNPERVVKETVGFVTIRNGKVESSLLGMCEKGIGVTYGNDPDINDPSTILDLNSEDHWVCITCIAAADEFKTPDNKTLVDEEAGIKYTFDFSVDLCQTNGRMFTAEKINN